MKKYISIVFIAVGSCFLAGILASCRKADPVEGIPSLEIFMETASLENLNNGDKHTVFPKNRIQIRDPEQAACYMVENVEIRGRGNSSWKMPKKSYQIHFEKKIELLGMDAAKKWVLIANYADASLMRNRLMYELAGQLMDYVPESRHVELYINHTYLGSYLLCEKIEIGEGRVALQQERGVLAEVDNIYYYEEEHSFESPVSGSHFVLKDIRTPGLAETAFADFESSVLQLERLLYAPEKNWEQISKLIDVESFIKYYYMEEFAENSDSCRTSLYLYQDGPEDVLHMGPVWDFDKALGYSMRGKFGGDPYRDYVCNIEEYMGTGKDLTWYAQLVQIPEFRQEAVRIYQEEVRPVLEQSGVWIEEYRQELRNSAEANFKCWDLKKIPEVCDHEPYFYENWEEAVDGLKSWVTRRTEYLNQIPLSS